MGIQRIKSLSLDFDDASQIDSSHASRHHQQKNLVANEKITVPEGAHRRFLIKVCRRLEESDGRTQASGGPRPRAMVPPSGWCGTAPQRKSVFARSTDRIAPLGTGVLPRTVVNFTRGDPKRSRRDVHSPPWMLSHRTARGRMPASTAGETPALHGTELPRQASLQIFDLGRKARQMTQVGIHLLELGQRASRSSPIGEPLA